MGLALHLTQPAEAKPDEAAFAASPAGKALITGSSEGWEQAAVAAGTDDLRYPIGRFSLESEVTPDRVAAWIDDIASLPDDLRQTVLPLTDGQLDTPYRPGGWTVRQVVHHLADSHMNSYIRFKLALTEDRPVIKAYDEKRWAELSDSREPIASSLDLLAALHSRWVDLLRGLSWAQLQREFVHPESGASLLAVTVGAYSWHGRHHLAHIERLLEREGWGAGAAVSWLRTPKVVRSQEKKAK